MTRGRPQRPPSPRRKAPRVQPAKAPAAEPRATSRPPKLIQSVVRTRRRTSDRSVGALENLSRPKRMQREKLAPTARQMNRLGPRTRPPGARCAGIERRRSTSRVRGVASHEALTELLPRCHVDDDSDATCRRVRRRARRHPGALTTTPGRRGSTVRLRRSNGSIAVPSSINTTAHRCPSALPA